MKKLLIMLVGILALASCSNNRYAELVPADADVVVTFNTKDILEGCGAEDNMDEIIREIEKVSPIGIPKNIKAILKEPKKLGLRLDKDAYFWFERAKERGGLVIGMHDKDDFEKSMKKMAGDIGFDVHFSKKDGYTVMEIDGGDDEDVIVVLNDDYLMIAASDNGGAENVAKSLAELEKDEQYIHTKRFDRLDDAEGQIKMDISPSVALSAKEWNQMKKEMQLQDFDVAPEEIGCILAANMKKGGIYATADIYCLNDEMNDKINESKKRMHNIEGALTQYVPKNYLCWMGANVNMPEMMEEESVQKAMKMAAENGINIENIVKSFSGDLQCFVTPAGNVIFNAQMGSEYDDNKVGSELSQLPQIEKKGTGEYVVKQQSYNWWTEEYETSEIAWANVKNNVLTITNDKEYTASKNNSGDILGDLESDVKKSTFALVVNKNGLKELDERFADLIDYFASFCLTVSKDMQVKASLKFSKDWTLFELIKKMQKDGVIEKAIVESMSGNNYDYIEPDTTAWNDYSYDDEEFDALDSIACDWE